MEILENISLKNYNSFGINAYAKQFATLTNAEDLVSIEENSWQNIFVLGGGSNILFTKNVDALVLQNKLEGIQVIAENENDIIIEVGAGTNWHGFVLHCIQNNWGGVENLALIPGSVGASPIQNIGAYGVEVKDVFNNLTAYNYKEKKWLNLAKSDCQFEYRESIFKHELKGSCVITAVQFRLSKKHTLNTSYGAIQQELEKMKVGQVDIQAIAQAVINIRSSKLPNPKEMGNAGSFFKNPTIPVEQFEALQKQFAEIVFYKAGENKIKLAAGWLIEQCGFKGYRKGDAGCHSKQALVLVNYGNATGAEIINLSNEIINAVQQKFGVHLEREVNIY
jgi:UDP-N-acetylmuramate dehydrogenase